MTEQEVQAVASQSQTEGKITEQGVQLIATPLIRKYDWETEQIGYGVKLTVNDGEKYASVTITTGEDIESEIQRAIDAVDAHEYGELEG